MREETRISSGSFRYRMKGHHAVQRHKSAMHSSQNRWPARGDVLHAFIFNAPVKIAQEPEQSPSKEADVILVHPKQVKFGILDVLLMGSPSSPVAHGEGGQAGMPGRKSKFTPQFFAGNRPGIAKVFEPFRGAQRAL